MSLRVFRSAQEWKQASSGAGAYFAIGNFDGVHVGHQRIFRVLVDGARAARQPSAVLTFDPHPGKVLRPETAPPLISTLAQRLACFEAAGLDGAVVLTFTREFASLSPEEFARDILKNALGATAIFVGDNFRFGHRQSGDTDTLVRLGERLGFRVQEVKPVRMRGELVSSTLVRQAIREGRVESAGRMLGRPFALTGEIRSGTGLGSQLIVPTLNLAYDQELVPGRGVYATEALVRGKLYRAATNVGFRPTFDGDALVVESHLLDFAGEIKSGPMELRFWKRLREEKKFATPADLRGQVLRDIARTRQFFSRFDHRRETASARS